MAIVVVPRLVAHLIQESDALPLGERIWGDTEVRLPAPVPTKVTHRLTGACVQVRSDAQGAYLRAADLFEHFPIACLQGQ